MNISHLSHSSDGIHCKCGYAFEVKGWQLSDPYQLTIEKERIAAKHHCNLQPKQPERAQTRVWRHPTTAGQLANYWSQATRREMVSA